MSIDTGLNLSYDKNFPVANVNQSSQKFRDNFYIIKTAIENLQVAQTNGSSVLTIQSSVQSSGAIQFDLQFRNNSFKLPLNTTATGEGLIRYNTTTKNLEFYNTAWSALIGYDANGAVNLTTLNVSTKLTIASNPTTATDVVNLGYLNGVLSTIANAQTSQYNILSNAVAQNSNAITTEIAQRIAGDDALSNAIAALANTVQAQNASSNVAQLAADLDNLEAALAVEANTRATADSNIQNTIALQANTLNQHTTQIATLTQGEIDEATYRVQGDQYLYTLINAIVDVNYATSNALSDETNARVGADNYINSTVSALNGQMVTANIQITNLQTQVNSFGGIINETFNNYPRVFVQNSAPQSNSDAYPDTAVYISNNSLWFDNSNSNALSYFDGNAQIWEPITLTASTPDFTDVANTTVRFPNSTVIIDADHYLLFQGIPNQVGGNDGAGVVFDSTNLDYAYLAPTYYAAINNAIAYEMAANVTLTQTDARHRVAANAAHMNSSYPFWANTGLANLEFGSLRIFVTNDFDNGQNADSMALEPAASLYLNPGWQGGGQEQTTTPASRISNKTNARIVVGNAITNSVTITALTGDIKTIGNVTANNGNFTNMNITNGALTLTNSQFYLPQSDITIDAGHSLFFQSLPNQANGVGDLGFVTYDANNFDYMPFYMISAYPNTVVTNGSTVLSTILSTYGTIANANAHYEFSTLRLGTQNDAGGTMVADSMALEPAADLYLNPGWVGTGAGRTQISNGNVYGQTTGPWNPVDVRQYSYVVIGNSTSRAVTFNAKTGDMISKGYIHADGDITGLSDISVKKDLKRIENALDKITSISGYTFTRTDLPNEPVQMGVIAQEVNEIAPELITTLPNGKMAVAYGNMAGMFIEALKEIKEELAEIKRRLG